MNKKSIFGGRGASLVEYGALTGLIAVVAIVSVSLLGSEVESGFNETTEQLAAVAPGAPGALTPAPGAGGGDAVQEILFDVPSTWPIPSECSAVANDGSHTPGEYCYNLPTSPTYFTDFSSETDPVVSRYDGNASGAHVALVLPTAGSTTIINTSSNAVIGVTPSTPGAHYVSLAGSQCSGMTQEASYQPGGPAGPGDYLILRTLAGGEIWLTENVASIYCSAGDEVLAVADLIAAPPGGPMSDYYVVDGYLASNADSDMFDYIGGMYSEGDPVVAIPSSLEWRQGSGEFCLWDSGVDAPVSYCKQSDRFSPNPSDRVIY